MIDHYVNETCYFEPTDIAVSEQSDYTYLWEFDNGSKQTSFRASTKWNKAGSYKIKLTVTKTSNGLASSYDLTVNIGLKNLTYYVILPDEQPISPI